MRLVVSVGEMLWCGVHLQLWTHIRCLIAGTDNAFQYRNIIVQHYALLILVRCGCVMLDFVLLECVGI